jgi:histidinol-phosphatase (PHP family)
MAGLPIADNHVHSQWSWDATDGSMERSCRRAADLGLPSVAFTEHADWIRGQEGVFDPGSYFDSIERCRAAYPGLRILSGVELGEPHRYPAEAAGLLALPFDRVLASVHCVDWKGDTTDACEEGFLTSADVTGIFGVYLAEVLALLDSGQPFQVLAHLDYPKRYWPPQPSYLETQFEEEFRAVLRAAALREVALEVNTTRGGDHARHLCPGPLVLKWWREEGGRAISFGSDAHSPDAVAAGFELAREVVSSLGFRPQTDPAAFWLG